MRKQWVLSIYIVLTCCIAGATNYFVSVDTGDDNNVGSLIHPFKTIQKAADVMIAGDTCFVREGVYREKVRPANSGIPQQPIVFTAYQNDKVTISALDIFSNWEQHEANIYKTGMPWDLGEDNNVYYNKELCDLARWPNNTDHQPFTLETETSDAGDTNWIRSTAIPDFPWANGGILWYLGSKKWTSFRASITAYNVSNNTIDFVPVTSDWVRSSHDPKDGGEFYLLGIYEALDYPYEFYFDAQTDTLFIYVPSGEDPNDHLVEGRAREHVFDFDNRNYITIKNINVFGGDIIMTNAVGCVLKGMLIEHGSNVIGVDRDFYISEAAVQISGSNNLVEHCEVAYGMSNGVRVNGKHNVVRDCYVHDFDYMGSYSAPIVTVGGGDSNLVTQCEVAYGGRDGIRGPGADHEFSYNDVHHVGEINNDCGLFYVCCSEENHVVHHNWFHDANESSSVWAVGVYLDNSIIKMNVHHNVFWNIGFRAFQVNVAAKDINLYNNSLYNVNESMGAYPNSSQYDNVKVINNLSSDFTWMGTQLKSNYNYNFIPYNDVSARDFTLVSGSQAIDFGTVLPGITDDFLGVAPDAGAYEAGDTTWVAGITWDKKNGPSTIDCNGDDGGIAFIDSCNVCAGGNTGMMPSLNCITGDKEAVNDDAYQIYPVPASNYLFIDGLDRNEEQLVTIFNTLGKNVYQTISYGTNKLQVDLSSLSSGVYFIQLQGNTVSKIVVNHR